MSLCHGMLEDDQVMLGPSTVCAAELIEVMARDGGCRISLPGMAKYRVSIVNEHFSASEE